MKYTEEEKQAIQSINSFKSIKLLYGEIYVMHLEQLKKYQTASEVILNLLEKYQKEIDSLEIKLDDKETELQILKDDIEADEIMYKSELEESYISKEAIRKKIEEIQIELDKKYSAEKISIFSGNTYMEKFKLLGRIYALKELLGDE